MHSNFMSINSSFTSINFLIGWVGYTCIRAATKYLNTNVAKKKNDKKKTKLDLKLSRNSYSNTR